MNKKGFTLIELLVVIAIIGILSSIVLVALRGARDKAKNARIISDMSQIRSLAEVLYKDDYDDLCDFPSTCGGEACCSCSGGSIQNELDALCEDIYDQNSNANFTDHKGDEYCVQVSLVGGGSFCIDSTGYAGKTRTGCDGSNYDCQ